MKEWGGEKNRGKIEREEKGKEKIKERRKEGKEEKRIGAKK